VPGTGIRQDQNDADRHDHRTEEVRTGAFEGEDDATEPAETTEPIQLTVHVASAMQAQDGIASCRE
jgi:hypothetical protein